MDDVDIAACMRRASARACDGEDQCKEHRRLVQGQAVRGATGCLLPCGGESAQRVAEWAEANDLAVTGVHVQWHCMEEEEEGGAPPDATLGGIKRTGFVCKLEETCDEEEFARLYMRYVFPVALLRSAHVHAVSFALREMGLHATPARLRAIRESAQQLGFTLDCSGHVNCLRLVGQTVRGLLRPFRGMDFLERLDSVGEPLLYARLYMRYVFPFTSLSYAGASQLLHTHTVLGLCDTEARSSAIQELAKARGFRVDVEGDVRFA